MTIDPKKPYTTRDGREVRIYAVDGGGPCPVHGAVYGHGCWQIREWHHDGRWAGDTADPYDLIPAPIRHTLWVARRGDCWGHQDYACNNEAIAREWLVERPNYRPLFLKQIEVTEGEGLEG